MVHGTSSLRDVHKEGVSVHVPSSALTKTMILWLANTLMTVSCLVLHRRRSHIRLLCVVVSFSLLSFTFTASLAARTSQMTEWSSSYQMPFWHHGDFLCDGTMCEREGGRAQAQAQIKERRHQLSGLSLTELTNNPTTTITCPDPLVPVYDTIVEPSSSHAAGNRRIPRIIHVSMKNRCIHKDLADAVRRWQAALPSHSLYFHDDDAVDRLFQQDWPQFPHLNKVFNCVKFGGAMKIDLWRVLVLYKYGGIYTDIDNWPGNSFNEDTIRPDDGAFFVSDGWTRPSQWFQAMEPRHPIAYFTMLEILSRVLAMEDISKPKLVFVTGPDALKHGYGMALFWKKDIIFGAGVFQGKFGTTARKIGLKDSKKYVVGSLGGTFSDVVPWNTTLNMTRRQKIEAESGMVHWPYAMKKREGTFKGSCVDYLYMLDHNVTAKS